MHKIQAIAIDDPGCLSVSVYHMASCGFAVQMWLNGLMVVLDGSSDFSDRFDVASAKLF